MVYLAQCPWNLDSLRTMLHTLAATDAMACLTQLRHSPVISYQENSSSLSIFRIIGSLGHVAFVDAFVVMKQHPGNIYPVRAWHTVFAIVAGDGGIRDDESGRII